MRSLPARMSKLEQAVTLRSPMSMTNAQIIAGLMSSTDPATHARTRRCALERLKNLMRLQNPDRPVRPPTDAIMIASLLNADLEPYAVNEKHRQLIHCMYTAV